MGSPRITHTFTVRQSPVSGAAVRPTTLVMLSVTLGMSLCAACTVGPAQPPAPTPMTEPGREPMWIAGEVIGVDNIPIDEYNDSTVQLVVATEGEQKVRVRLAPGWFLNERGLNFRREQRVEFYGEPDPVEQDLVVARGIRAGTTTLELRDPTGVETWKHIAPAPLGSGPQFGDGGTDAVPLK